MTMRNEPVSTNIGEQPKPPIFRVYTEGKLAFTIRADNSIHIEDEISLDDAAKAFWEAVRRHAPVTPYVQSLRDVEAAHDGKIPDDFHSGGSDF